MYQVQADKEKNLLRITFSKRVDAEEAKRCRNAVEKALDELTPGFLLLTDLSNLESMDYACATEIGAVMDLCRRKGVAEVVRVIPDIHKDIGFNVLTYFHYGHAVPVRTVETLDEAIKACSF